MSSNSIFGSLPGENRWITEMSSTFPRGQVVRLDIDIPPCVFRVPESLTRTKPEAYAPQQIGLGPYHHLRPDLYTMQRKKLYAVMNFLDDERLKHFQLVFDELMNAETFIRASYDRYLDVDLRTLAWIFTIDATYLLHLLRSYHPERNSEAEDAARDEEMKKLAGDILMLENQIPVFSFIRVQRVLNLSSRDHRDEYVALFGEFNCFCEKVSPLKLNMLPCSIEIMGMMGQGHLLGVLYQLIVTNRYSVTPTEVIIVPHTRGATVDNVSRGVGILAVAGFPGADIVHQLLSLMREVLWETILGLIKSRRRDSVEEINIPFVSQLTKIAGIGFAPTEGGIRSVEFDETGKKISLPVITLHSDSEIVLRNLLAYEAASVKQGSALELAAYVDLMCGLVDTPKDVHILRKKKIIEGDLTDAEIANIFNGIPKSTGDKEEKRTNIEIAIGKVNEQYDNIPRVKVYRFIKKHVPTIGKFLRVFSVALVFALSVLLVFCQIYGCNKRWFNK